MRLSVVCLSLVAVASCSSKKHSLFIDVRTDLVPRLEFTGVHVERLAALPGDPGAAVLDFRDYLPRPGDDFTDRVRVAELEGLSGGDVILRASLLDATGAAALERVVLVNVRSNTVVTLVFTRSCRGVVCPQDGDDPSHVACLGGRCVDPRCTPESPEACPAPACVDGASCPPPPDACAEAHCVDGVCMMFERDGACPEASACIPETGCADLPQQSDAGTDGGRDGGVMDAGDVGDAGDVVLDPIARISEGPGGEEADGDSSNPVISANGRVVAFSSAATNLVAGDANGVDDVFVYDLVTRTIARASVATGGVEGNGPSGGEVTLSGDGRVVSFESEATNLVPGDVNGTNDVFRHDLDTGTTVRASALGDGTGSDAHSDRAWMSRDGEWVAFASYGTNLVADDTNGVKDVFVWERMTGTLTRESFVAAAPATSDADRPALSADGRFVAFHTYGALVADDTNGVADIYLRDRMSGALSRVSVGAGGLEASTPCFDPVVSDDGSLVVFKEAGSLVGLAEVGHVLALDRTNGELEVVSVSSSGEPGNSYSGEARTVGEGRYVLFNSLATNLAPGATTGELAVFLRDRLEGTTVLISATPAGTIPNAFSYGGGISEDGGIVVFASNASDLGVPDLNGVTDIYVVDRR